MSKIVLAFTEEEANKTQCLLENLARILKAIPGAGKLEEDYWSYIYHKVRNAPTSNLSNLPMRDFLHAGLGVEMKLLSKNSPSAMQGKTLMHPAATRTIDWNEDMGADACKEQVLCQFGNQIQQFRERVLETSTNNEADIRWGILLWNRKLSEFLYFEEEMAEPDPDDYYAEIIEKTRTRGGRTKTSKSLWIYEKSTEKKKFSVTHPENGAKVQPYFDVPNVGQGAYVFTVSEEELYPLWLTKETMEKFDAKRKDKTHEEFLLELLNL